MPGAKTKSDLWLELGSRIGFFTLRTAQLIPQRPGVYAWFFPISISGDSPESIQEEVEDTLRVAAFGSRAVGDMRMGWEQLDVVLERKPLFRFERSASSWKRITKNPDAFGEVINALYVATLFTRPLYVGLTTRPLSERYAEHTGGASQFAKRFDTYMSKVGLQTTVSDLLFVCVPLSKGSLNKEQVEVAEDLLKHLCQPPFGER